MTYSEIADIADIADRFIEGDILIFMPTPRSERTGIMFSGCPDVRPSGYAANFGYYANMVQQI